MATLIRAVPCVFIGIADAGLAHIRIVPKLAHRTVEAGPALVAVDPLGIVGAVQTPPAAFVTSVHVQTQLAQRQLLLVHAFSRVPVAIAHLNQQ